MKLVPMTPADLYTMRLGGLYDDQGREPPFVAGHEGVAVVVKVRQRCHSSELQGSSKGSELPAGLSFVCEQCTCTMGGLHRW